MALKLMQVTDPDVVLDLIDNIFNRFAETVELKLAGGRCLAEAVVARMCLGLPALRWTLRSGSRYFGQGSARLLESRGEVLMGQQAPPLIGASVCSLHRRDAARRSGRGGDDRRHRAIGDAGPVQIFRQVAPGENVIHKGEA